MGACWILHRTAEGRHFHFSSVQTAAKSTGNKAERLRHPWAYECLWASYKAGSCMTCWLVSVCLSRLYVNNNHQSKTERESQQNDTMDTDTCIYQQTAVGPGGQGFKLRTNLERQYWGICNDYCRTRSPKAALNMQWRCSMLQRWMSL